MDATLTTKKRSQNWSERDCLHLASLMGETVSGEGSMTYHAYSKTRFGNGVTAITKREKWEVLVQRFNACSDVKRNENEVEKKWANMVSKHRNLYCSFVSATKMTGGGPAPDKLSPLTDQMMNVIGRWATTVVGVPGKMDSAICHSPSASNDFCGPTIEVCGASGEIPLVESDADDNLVTNAMFSTVCEDGLQMSQFLLPVENSRSCCECRKCQDLYEIKKKCLELQIEYYSKMLKK